MLNFEYCGRCVFGILYDNASGEGATCVCLFSGYLFFHAKDGYFLRQVRISGRRICFEGFVLNGLNLIAFVVAAIRGAARRFQIGHLRASTRSEEVTNRILCYVAQRSRLFCGLLDAAHQRGARAFTIRLLRGFVWSVFVMCQCRYAFGAFYYDRLY